MPNFNAVKTTKEILAVLPKRAREVLERRFGIGKSGKGETLEAIGTSYGITRERVRQIESYGLKKLRGHELTKEREDVFKNLKEELSGYGGVSEEENFLTTLARSPEDKNHLRFLLTLHDDFKKHKEDEEFLGRWSVSDKHADAAHESLRLLHKGLESSEPITHEEIKKRLAGTARNVLGEDVSDEIVSSWLRISKKLAVNKLGEWGLADSPHISPRGIRDLAYLVMKRHGSPLHFSEVAEHIIKNLGEKAHVQTVHNELIKDGRFVLVGRGLYALKEWGYGEGTVKDVIKNILASEGALPKSELIEKVLKERHVKPSTILINLQNKRYFKTLEDGRYTVV